MLKNIKIKKIIINCLFVIILIGIGFICGNNKLNNKNISINKSINNDEYKLLGEKVSSKNIVEIGNTQYLIGNAKYTTIILNDKINKKLIYITGANSPLRDGINNGVISSPTMQVISY